MPDNGWPDWYRNLETSAVLFPSQELALFEMTGDDRLDWLQGQVTNDVLKLNTGNRLSFCLCTSTGQLLVVAEAWALENRILISCPATEAGQLVQRVEDAVILEDVQLTRLDPELFHLSIQGPRSEEFLAEHFDFLQLADRQSRIKLEMDRSGRGGFDVWIPRADQDSLSRWKSQLSVLGPEEVGVVRIEAGIPTAGIDYSPKTLPPELGKSFEESHVSYSKGCYTGQEVLMRIYSRGHTNKTWVGFRTSLPVALGTELKSTEGDPVGHVTGVAVSPKFGTIGSATVRNQYAEAGMLLLANLEGSARSLEIRTTPFLHSGLSS